MNKTLYRSLFVVVCIVGSFVSSRPALAEDDYVMEKVDSWITKHSLSNGVPLKRVDIKAIQSGDREIELAVMEDPATGMAYPLLVSTKTDISSKDAHLYKPRVALFHRAGIQMEGNKVDLPFGVSQATWTVSFFGEGGTTVKAELYGKLMMEYSDNFKPPYISIFSMAPQMDILSARFNGEKLEYYRPRGASAIFAIFPESGEASGTVEFELKLNEAANYDAEVLKKLGITPEERIAYSVEKQYVALYSDSNWAVKPAVFDNIQQNCTATAVFYAPSADFFIAGERGYGATVKKESRSNMKTISGNCGTAAGDNFLAFKAKRQKVSVEGSEVEIVSQDDKNAETARQAFIAAATDFKPYFGPLKSPRGLTVVYDPTDNYDRYGNIGGEFTDSQNGDFIFIHPRYILRVPMLYHEYFHAWENGLCETFANDCDDMTKRRPGLFYNEAFAYFLGSTKDQGGYQSVLYDPYPQQVGQYQKSPKFNLLSFESNSTTKILDWGEFYKQHNFNGPIMLKVIADKFGKEVVIKSIGDFMTSGRMFNDDVRFSDFFKVLKANGADADSFYKSWIEQSRLPQYCIRGVSFKEQKRGKGTLRVTMEQKPPFYDLKLPIFAGNDSTNLALIGTVEFSTATADFEFEVDGAPDLVSAYMSGGATKYLYPMDLQYMTGFNFPKWEVALFPKALVVLPDKKDCVKSNEPYSVISSLLNDSGFKNVDCLGYDARVSEFDEYRAIFVAGKPPENSYLNSLKEIANPDNQLIKMDFHLPPVEKVAKMLRAVVPVEYRDAKIDWLLSFGEKPEPAQEEYPQARQFFFLEFPEGFPLEKTLRNVFDVKDGQSKYNTILYFDASGAITQTDTIYNNNKTLVFRDALSRQYTDRCDSSNTNLFRTSGWGFSK